MTKRAEKTYEKRSIPQAKTRAYKRLTTNQVEERVLNALKALRITTHKEVSLDTKVSQVITGDLEDAQFPAELRKQFPALSDRDLRKIQDLYPVKCRMMEGESIGLNLGRKAEKDCTFREIAGYIFSRYKLGFSKTE